MDPEAKHSLDRAAFRRVKSALSACHPPCQIIDQPSGVEFVRFGFSPSVLAPETNLHSTGFALVRSLDHAGLANSTLRSCSKRRVKGRPDQVFPTRSPGLGCDPRQPCVAILRFSATFELSYLVRIVVSRISIFCADRRASRGFCGLLGSPSCVWILSVSPIFRNLSLVLFLRRYTQKRVIKKKIANV